MYVQNKSINQLLETGTTHIEYPANTMVPVSHFKESIAQLDSRLNLVRGYSQSVSSGELTREEFDIALRLFNDEHFQNMDLQEINISHLPLFDTYFKAKHALHDKIFPKKWRYIPRCERELNESTPPKIFTMPDGREVTSGFYCQVYGIGSMPISLLKTYSQLKIYLAMNTGQNSTMTND